VLTANVGLPHRSTREAIALAIHLVVHIDRWEGRRAVREVLAVEGYDHQADRYTLVPFTSDHATGGGGAA
jgi:Flp pilus assembly CpaF family ATPase